MSLNALYTSATGVQAQKDNVDIHAHNIANMNTDGYKEMRALFHDMAYETHNLGTQSSTNGSINPTGIQIGHGVHTAATIRIMEQGGIQTTDRPLDMMINGGGFFQIEQPSGETAYTRAGAMVISPEGLLETVQGYKLLPNITIPPGATDISVNSEGQVYVKIAGEQAIQELGSLEVATFINPPGLEAIGNNLFNATDASGEAVVGNPGSTGFGVIMQGALEKSNVKPVVEITSLIEAQRAYEMNTNAMKKADEMIQQAAQILRV